MKKIPFNHDWQYTEGALSNPLMMMLLRGWQPVTLPHDYQILRERSPKALTADNEGWTEGAALYYKKTFTLPEKAKGQRTFLEIEAVAGVCQIWVNGRFVTKHMNPYTGILFETTNLLVEGTNTVMIHVDSRMKPNSRWYVGTGLYRRAFLHMAAPVTVVPETIHVTTEALTEDSAAITARAEISGDADQVIFRVLDPEGNILASQMADMTALSGESTYASNTVDQALPRYQAEAALSLSGITPWSPEHPVLYGVEAVVISGETEDVTSVRTGFRTIRVSHQKGFELNGVSMKLKGGCVHHDLGLVGAAEFETADRRRIRILQENGFNAIRGAHNPFGPGFYEACDEMGMLVIEEAFDEWVLGRTDFGLHITFEDRWERDLEDMVRRDYNHPSIIMWSTGNEVEERDGSADGFAWSKRLADKIRTMDTTRPVSASACSLFMEYAQRPGANADKSVTGNQALNMAYDTFAEGRDLWGPATAPYFAPLDVAGYNYKVARYAYDGEKFPDRVIYGSESYPRAALQSYLATEQNDHVIGDFVWTAWDYLGEVGIGRYEVTDNFRPAGATYPWLLAYCSDIDVLGNKRPQSYYRDVVWQRTKAPKLFCLPPLLTGKPIARLSWGWLPVERNYTYHGQEGENLEVHVYADAEEVELIQNGKSLGTLPCTLEEQYQVIFTVPYVPGEITVIARTGGEEIGRDTLTTTGETVSLAISVDRGDQDRPLSGKTLEIPETTDPLTFVTIQALDQEGNSVLIENREVTMTVEGAELLALGTSDPKPDRVIPYSTSSVPLFEGKAQAILRRTAKDTPITVNISLGNLNTELVL